MHSVSEVDADPLAFTDVGELRIMISLCDGLLEYCTGKREYVFVQDQDYFIT